MNKSRVGFWRKWAFETPVVAAVACALLVIPGRASAEDGGAAPQPAASAATVSDVHSSGGVPILDELAAHVIASRRASELSDRPPRGRATDYVIIPLEGDEITKPKTFADAWLFALSTISAIKKQTGRQVFEYPLLLVDDAVAAAGQASGYSDFFFAKQVAQIKSERQLSIAFHIVGHGTSEYPTKLTTGTGPISVERLAGALFARIERFNNRPGFFLRFCFSGVASPLTVRSVDKRSFAGRFAQQMFRRGIAGAVHGYLGKYVELKNGGGAMVEMGPATKGGSGAESSVKSDDATVTVLVGDAPDFERVRLPNLVFAKSSVLVGTDVGIEEFRPGMVTQRATNVGPMGAVRSNVNGISSNDDIGLKVNGLRVVGGKIVVAATDEGVLIRQAGKEEIRLTTREGLADVKVYDVEVFQNHIFAGTSQGLSVAKLAEKKFSTYGEGEGLGAAKVYHVAFSEGHVFLATSQGVFVGDVDQFLKSNGFGFKPFNRSHGLACDKVYKIYFHPTGAAFVATEAGLSIIGGDDHPVVEMLGPAARPLAGHSRRGSGVIIERSVSSSSDDELQVNGGEASVVRQALVGKAVYDIAFDEDEWVAATSDGLWVSLDAGVSFHRAGPPQLRGPVYGVGLTADSLVVAGASGVWMAKRTVRGLEFEPKAAMPGNANAVFVSTPWSQ